MKKRIITMVLSSTILMCGGTVIPTIASASSLTANTTQLSKVNELNIPIKHTVEVKGNDTIVTIKDSDLFAYLSSQGIDVGNAGMLRKNGVTKIVWHGAVTKGNVDLYLSKNWLNTITAAGVGAIAGALGALLPGAGWGAAIGAISGIIGAQSFSNGKIFKVRSFKYAGMVNQ